ncbi:MAG: GNAT family N-acetyltransferase [Dehalococcoidia bacterium]|nr:GNAT family N-acetyltransferase [Dehalococcoidia bacterium]MBL7124956.1 GNAT family N-acetyltransferase [Dehalococcoidales bacterium]
MTTIERRESKIRIRPMEPEDIDSILAIDRKITGVRRAITYTDLITGDLGGALDLSFVAEANGEVAGFILARRTYVGEPVTEVGLIQILGVDPDYWHQGIASKLVNALLDTCQSKQLNAVRIMVNERDSQLQGLFQRLGFRRGKLIDYTKTFES